MFTSKNQVGINSEVSNEGKRTFKSLSGETPPYSMNISTEKLNRSKFKKLNELEAHLTITALITLHHIYLHPNKRNTYLLFIYWQLMRLLYSQTFLKRISL